MFDALKLVIIRKLLSEIVELIEENKAKLKANVQKALDETDIPTIPDNIEKPLDSLIAETIGNLLDGFLGTLKAVSAK